MSDTSSYTNSSAGTDALKSNTVGINNTAMGSYSIFTAETANNNTGVGCNSLFFTTTGANNTAIGAGSMCNNTEGQLNVAVGSSSLEGVAEESVGSENVAIGVQALYINTGGQNTAVGAYAGISNTSGSQNTFIGALSGLSGENIDHATAIGAGAEVTQSNTIQLGTSADSVYTEAIFLQGTPSSYADNQVVPKSYIEQIQQGAAGQGLYTTIESGITVFNVDLSLNFLESIACSDSVTAQSGSFVDLSAATANFDTMTAGTGTFTDLVTTSLSISDLNVSELAVGTGTFSSGFVSSAPISFIVGDNGLFIQTPATNQLSLIDTSGGSYGNISDIDGTLTIESQPAYGQTAGNIILSTGKQHGYGYIQLTSGDGAFLQTPGVTQLTLVDLSNSSSGTISNIAGIMSIDSTSAVILQTNVVEIETTVGLTAGTGSFTYLTGVTASANYITADTFYADYVSGGTAYANYITGGTAYADYIRGVTASANYISADTFYADYVSGGTAYANYITGGTAYVDYIAGVTASANYITGGTAYANYVIGGTSYADYVMGVTGLFTYVSAESGTFTDLSAANFTADTFIISDLNAASGTFTDLTAANFTADNFTIDTLTIAGLSAESIEITESFISNAAINEINGELTISTQATNQLALVDLSNNSSGFISDINGTLTIQSEPNTGQTTANVIINSTGGNVIMNSGNGLLIQTPSTNQLTLVDTTNGTVDSSYISYINGTMTVYTGSVSTNVQTFLLETPGNSGADEVIVSTDIVEIQTTVGLTAGTGSFTYLSADSVTVSTPGQDALLTLSNTSDGSQATFSESAGTLIIDVTFAEGFQIIELNSDSVGVTGDLNISGNITSGTASSETVNIINGNLTLQTTNPGDNMLLTLSDETGDQTCVSYISQQGINLNIGNVTTTPNATLNIDMLGGLSCGLGFFSELTASSGITAGTAYANYITGGTSYADYITGVTAYANYITGGTAYANYVTGGTGVFEYIEVMNQIHAHGGFTTGTAYADYISGSTAEFEYLTVDTGISAGTIDATTASFDYLTVTNSIYAPAGISAGTGTFLYASGGTAEFEYIAGGTGEFGYLSIENQIYAPGGITAGTGSFEYVNAGTGSFTQINTVDMEVLNLVATNITSSQILASTMLQATRITGTTGTFTHLNTVQQIKAPLGITAAGTSGFNYVTATQYTTTSDYRIKNSVTGIEGDAAFSVDKLVPITYINSCTQSREIGMLAHEVQEVFPFLVTGEKDAEELQSVNYIGLISLLVKEVKELKARVAVLEGAATC